jgi:rRNA-processing protein FCF1
MQIKLIDMTTLFFKQYVRNFFITSVCIFLLTSCDRSSSPEGRMSMKLEDLQQEMVSNLKQQNQAMLDSLSKIRKEIRELKEVKK